VAAFSRCRPHTTDNHLQLATKQFFFEFSLINSTLATTKLAMADTAAAIVLMSMPKERRRGHPSSNPLQPHLAGVLEHHIALRVLQVLIQPYAVPGLAQDTRQGGFADLDRLAPKVRPIQRQQVEGVEDRPRLVPTVAEQLKGSHALLVATHDFAFS
jgi:hypothetical protein